MENMGYLFVTYTVIWAVLFGYVLSLYRRQRRLGREIDSLKEAVSKQEADAHEGRLPTNGP